MILKTFIFFIFLLITFCLVLQLLMPNVQVSQHQWQTNSIKAQKFIYDSSTYDNIIVGSSLASRMHINGYCNISFSGLSIFDGLHLVSRMEQPMKNVFIETNFILRNEDEAFTGQLTNPFLYYLKKYIPTLRDGKQPLAIIASAMYNLLKNIKNSDKLAVQKKEYFDKSFFKILLANQIELYSKRPIYSDLNYSVNKLNYFVNALEKKGVNVVFFEMPVNEKLCELPQSITIRNALYRQFPPTKYFYIPQPNCVDYRTTDGIHLSEQEAVRYARYFISKSKVDFRFVPLSSSKL